MTLSQIAARSSATLTQFKSNDIGEITAVFAAEDVAELQKLQSLLSNSSLQDVNAQLDQAKKLLTVTALGK